ncbi:MAG TPA: DUF2946 family protein [Stellaceae bacterium]|jgi:hypothetical protein
MSLTRHRREHRNPRGALLAFIAVAIQAMLPFFIAVAMVEAANPAFADAVPICSADPAGHHDGGTTSDQHGSCPICAAVAAGQSFVAPPVPAIALPVSCKSVSLPSSAAPRLSSVAASSYQSRGPPAIA